MLLFSQRVLGLCAQQRAEVLIMQKTVAVLLAAFQLRDLIPSTLIR
jgi:hypothetical protein